MRFTNRYPVLYIIVFTYVFILLAMENAQAQSATALKEKLSNNTWQKRVLLVIAPSANDEQLLKQKVILNNQLAGLQERDMEIIYLPLNTIPKQDKEFLRKQFTITQNAFYTILIGKDGTEKLRSATPLATEKLFDTIDTMPMRQREMRNE